MASLPPPGQHARVRFAEVLAALVEQAQQKDPGLTVEAVAERAGVHRVTLAKIVAAARAGRPRAVDEETFWGVLRELGQDPEEALAPELLEAVASWRRMMALPATSAEKPRRGRKARPS